MKVAIIHDWLITYAGAERVLEQILKIYPDADMYAVVDFLPKESRAFLGNRTVRTSFIQKLPFAATKYRQYLPFMPLAVEQFDLSAYDLVISSSHAVAKGVLTGPDQVHVSYVHSPIRYAWDLQHQYLRQSGLDRGIKGHMAKFILHYMRLWDGRTANGVDAFIANSRFIAKRIWKAYRREAAVVYPPVNVDAFSLREDKEDFYLTASRMVPYKRLDLIVEAFSQMPTRQLVVIGDGPDFTKISRRKLQNVTFLGHQPFAVLKDHMERAKAFVFAAEEDFGIVLAEAQACGTPVIAYRRGGAAEIVQDIDTAKPTGMLFGEQTVPAVVHAIERFEKDGQAIKPHYCRENSLRFSPERFKAEFIDNAEKALFGKNM